MEVLVGAGGWAYFHTGDPDRLRAYSRVFRFVEVNSTFYRIPRLSQAYWWRSRVTPEFEFSVRCPRALTHRLGLEPSEESYAIMDKMVAFCRVLKAGVLHILTPESMEVTRDKVEPIRDLIGSVDLKGVQLAWEVRWRRRRMPPHLEALMRDLNITHCVDLSREDPAYTTDILYTRLLGRGFHNVYQFDDEELKAIYDRASRHGPRKAILAFHGPKMYHDAARLTAYKERGEFPQVTGSIGLASLKEVLNEDATFPATRDELIDDQGWKVIDLTPTKRIHAHLLLEKLSQKTYGCVEEVIRELGQTHSIA